MELFPFSVKWLRMALDEIDRALLGLPENACQRIGASEQTNLGQKLQKQAQVGRC
jgi:hypothetical protein